jgi:hypothetical protein
VPGLRFCAAMGPVQEVREVCHWCDESGIDQAADLRDCQGDLGAFEPIGGDGSAGGGCTGEGGQGERGQGDEAVSRGPAVYLVVIQSSVVFGGLEAFLDCPAVSATRTSSRSDTGAGDQQW